jgi:PAS domain S-box-containing protein
MKKYLLFIALFISIKICSSQQLQISPDKIKAQYIFYFANNIQWQAEEKITTFTIGIYGSDSVYNDLKSITDVNTRNGKPFKLIRFETLESISKTHILYVAKSKTKDVPKVAQKITSKNTLLITTGSNSRAYIMINFLDFSKAKHYEIVYENMQKENFQVTDKMLAYAGDETILREIYKESQKKLDEMQKQVAIIRKQIEEQTKEIEKQKEDIARQTKQITLQVQQIEKQKAEITEQQSKINIQKSELGGLMSKIDEQNKVLVEKMAILAKQEEDFKLQKLKLEKQQEDIDNRNNILKTLNKAIDDQKSKLENQKHMLKEQGSTIETQRSALLIFLAFIIAILILVFVILREYRAKKRINNELQEKNVEISNQKEEILAGSELLRQTNIELEKLSIVARETDNAILITDAKGNFEWVNESYTNIFGYTVSELIAEVSPNIIGPNTPEHIKERINYCITHKETINYEFSVKARDNKIIWVQATITPILDENNEVVKLIAIDSDITKIKEAENEILEKNALILEEKNKVEKSYKNMELLSEFGQRITSTLDLEAISGMIYDYVSTLMDVSSFGIALVNSHKETVEYKVFIEEGNRLPFFSKPINQDTCLTSWCVLNNKTVFINNLEKEFSKYVKVKPVFKSSKQPVSVLYVPLSIENKIIGSITAQSYDENAYTENDHNILQTLASYISIAIDNANAYKLIHVKNNHINGSIRYAQTIQKAILPSQRLIEKYFESFVIFRPKDVVSGDFYWFSEVIENGKTKLFIAVVDCTGHGVPGAFMSMIGNRLLNEIVNEKKIYAPSLILEQLNNGVIKALKQNETDNNDGMDLGICAIEAEKENYKITFAGAKRPLYFYEVGSDEIKEIRGDRKSIGGIRSRHEKTFQDHSFVLKRGGILYLSTDGLIDQNSESRKRFGTPKLIDILLNCIDKPMSEQMKKIEGELNMYQSKEEQRDDITFMGIKLK